MTSPSRPSTGNRHGSRIAAALALSTDSHQVEAFDFKTFCMHFNAYGMDGVPLAEADPSQLSDDTNFYPVTPSLFRLNLNSHVPRDIAYVTNVLSTPPPSTTPAA